MSEKNISTIIELLNEYRVEIPIVQRDYAQGRKDEHAKNVRINLLKDIKNAVLEERGPLDLSFVYGKEENGKFIPVDGQQRLTTLFLLHLYAFRNDEEKSEILHKFTYETRESSGKFFYRLVDNRSEVFGFHSKPSLIIKDTEWFLSSWINDPTIQSVLVVLDDIQEMFNEVEDLADKLTNLDLKLVTFKFKEMSDLGREDSLYIKLNARGKPLTDLENFKAQLLGRMRELKLDYIEEFEKQFDSDWTDFFWNRDKDKFDQDYYAFFEVLLTNHNIIGISTKWIDTLEYNKIGKDIFDTVFYTLNFLCKKEVDDEVKEIISDALSEKISYSERVLFHAATIYMLKSKSTDNGLLKKWLRIMKNLILNSNNIDNGERYRRAIESINALAEHWDNIVTFFSYKNKVDFFNQEQIKEEQIKAQIVLEDESFANAIYKAEKQTYFSGQIRGALYLSKKDNGVYDEKMFVKYWQKIASLFNESGPKYGNLLRQSLLTLSDYTIQVGSFKTLCVNDPKEAASTPSLKSLFSNHYETAKSLLDIIDINKDIKAQLEETVQKSNVTGNDWRYCFIKYPELFGYMSDRHLRIRILRGEMHIIPNKAANGHNYDLFLTALFEELKRRKIKKMEFDDGLGGFVRHKLYVENYCIMFENKTFIVRDEKGDEVFASKTTKPIEETADFIIKNIGFIQK